jgi:hypothetical protein
MPPTGSTFTDWQQVERETRLLIDEDFSWSEPPRTRRRILDEPIRATRSVAVLDYEPELPDEDLWIDHERPVDFSAPLTEDAPTTARAPLDRAPESGSHFDEMMSEWNAAFGDGADPNAGRAAHRAFNLADPGAGSPAQGGRRTVVITGRGDERYVPAPRRRRQSQLRFHERSGFSPDRAGLWAVLLSLALVIGCIVH